MPYPATSPGPGFQETPHASDAEEDACEPCREIRCGASTRAWWPVAAHKTDDADREEEDGERKAEDSRH